MMISIGSAIFGLGTGISLWNWVWSWRRGRPAEADPWQADTLEWATTSPPPHYNFAAIPLVESRHPLWDQKPLRYAVSGHESETRGLGRRGGGGPETPITSGLDTRPEGNLVIPHETYVPLHHRRRSQRLLRGRHDQRRSGSGAGIALAVVGVVSGGRGEPKRDLK